MAHQHGKLLKFFNVFMCSTAWRNASVHKVLKAYIFICVKETITLFFLFFFIINETSEKTYLHQLYLMACMSAFMQSSPKTRIKFSHRLRISPSCLKSINRAVLLQWHTEENFPFTTHKKKQHFSISTKSQISYILLLLFVLMALLLRVQNRLCSKWICLSCFFKVLLLKLL